MSGRSQNDTLAQIIKDFKKGDCTDRTGTFQHRNCKRKTSSEFVTPEKKLRPSGGENDSELNSPWETRRTKLEVLESRNRILMLETQVQQLHGVRKELEAVFENEKQALLNQQTWDRNMIRDLETRITVIRTREVDTKTELAEVKHKLENNKINFEKKVQKMQQIIDRLKDEQFESSSAEHDNSFAATQRIDELEAALIASEEEAEAQKQLVVELQAQLSIVNSSNRDLEMKEQALQKALLQIKQLEFEKGSYLEWQQQSKLQQNKMSSYRDLERDIEKLREDNKHLKEAIHNKLLLEEQVFDLQKRVDMNKNLQQEIADFEAKYSYLESQVNEWNSIAREICENTSPDSLLPNHMKQAFEQLQQKEIILTAEKVSLESDLRALKREATNTKHDFEKFKEKITELQNLHKNNQILIHRLKKKLLLVSRERDSYRAQLDSYEKELTISLGPSGPSKSIGDLQRDRLESCERMIEGYKDYVAKLETDLENVQVSSNVVPVRADQLSRVQAEVEQLRAENEKILKQRSDLEREMEQRALDGDSAKVNSLQSDIRDLRYENEKLTTECKEMQRELERILAEEKKATATKVLHFKQNPMTEASAKYDCDIASLQNEIDRLKKKIRNLEEGIENSKIEASFSGNNQELQSLREQVKSHELKAQRLKEVFKSTSQEFRDVCYMLLGYKIDRVNNSNYRLTSMYAESPEDYLSFQYNEGSLNLLETSFSSSLHELIDTHLRHHQSIPLFLGAVTVHLFNRITLHTNSIDI